MVLVRIPGGHQRNQRVADESPQPFFLSEIPPLSPCSDAGVTASDGFPVREPCLRLCPVQSTASHLSFIAGPASSDRRFFPLWGRGPAPARNTAKRGSCCQRAFPGDASPMIPGRAAGQPSGMKPQSALASGGRCPAPGGCGGTPVPSGAGRSSPDRGRAGRPGGAWPRARSRRRRRADACRRAG